MIFYSKFYLNVFVAPWVYVTLQPSFGHLGRQVATRKLRDVVEKRAISNDLDAVLTQIKEVT